MALIKAVHFYEGRAYCLVLDGDADSVTVVSEHGIVDPGEGEPLPQDPELRPGYYTPSSKAWIRRDEETDGVVGIMIEHFSEGFRQRGWRRVVPRSANPLALIEDLVQVVHDALVRLESELPPDDEIVFEGLGELMGETNGNGKVHV
jgi:hypothetical protein